MAMSRSSWVMLLGLPGIFLVATAVGFHRGSAPAPSLKVLVPPLAEGREFHAYFAFQAADCAGNLHVLDIFQRPVVAQNVSINGIALGAAPQAREASRRVAARGYALPVLLADGSMVQALTTLGMRSTPYLVVLDSRGEPVLTSHAPREAGEYVRLARRLSQLSKTGR